MKSLLLLNILAFSATAYGTLAGGRPNAFSGGLNAFAGVVNPANAVWLTDRFDIGGYWVHQKASFTNRDNNPLFPPGKIDLTYKTRNIFAGDFAIQKQFNWNYGFSLGLAVYSLPGHVKLRTKEPFRISGTTPLRIQTSTHVLSAIFSLKINCEHSIGASVDYLYLCHRRDGFQNSDNPLRSVSPGHVTNKGTDHSHGVGLVLGWRWKITDRLDFGAAWTKQSYCGQFRKYRGFEPHHARNYLPQLLGGGFTYKFTSKLAGRLETLWSNDSKLPNANDTIKSDGSLNLNKRGSNKSPGPGMQDVIYINAGLGYQFNPMLAVGIGYSHRIKWSRHSPLFIAHIYRTQVLYDILSFGVNFNYGCNNFFFVASHGFENKNSGLMPAVLGGGRFRSKKQLDSLSFSWGYQY